MPRERPVLLNPDIDRLGDTVNKFVIDLMKGSETLTRTYQLEFTDAEQKRIKDYAEKVAAINQRLEKHWRSDYSAGNRTKPELTTDGVLNILPVNDPFDENRAMARIADYASVFERLNTPAGANQARAGLKRKDAFWELFGDAERNVDALYNRYNDNRK